MMKTPKTASRTSGFALFLLGTTAFIELTLVAVLALASDEVADAAPFGGQGIAALGIGIATVAVAGAILGWRGTTGTARTVTATTLFVAVGLIIVMVMYFAVGGAVTLGLAALMAHAAFSVAMIGRAVLQTAPTTAER